MQRSRNRKSEEMPVEDIGVRLAELKEGWMGRRTAMVRVPKTDVQRLLQMGKLIVGWSKCEAKVIVYEAKNCFNCQEFGHIAKDCKKPQDNRECYRCGGIDHVAKDCASAMRCYVRGAGDHRVDFINCPRGRLAQFAGAERQDVLSFRIGEGYFVVLACTETTWSCVESASVIF